MLRRSSILREVDFLADSLWEGNANKAYVLSPFYLAMIKCLLDNSEGNGERASSGVSFVCWDHGTLYSSAFC
jgi:hypothetical protein